MCIQVMYELYQLQQPEQLIFSSIFTNQHTWVHSPNDTPNDAPNDKPELYTWMRCFHSTTKIVMVGHNSYSQH